MPQTAPPPRPDPAAPPLRPYRPIWVLLFSLALLVVWGGVTGPAVNNAREEFISYNDNFVELMILCFADLELKAVGIETFAAREKRLPVSLEECAADIPSLAAFLNQSTEYFFLSDSCQEPWYRSLGNEPPAALDCLGLPVAYRVAALPRRAFPWHWTQQEAWALVADRFDLWGSDPGERSFSLDTPFLSRIAVGQRHRLDRIRRLKAIHRAGLVLIVLAGSIFVFASFGRRRSFWVFIVMVTLGAIFAYGVSDFSQKMLRIHAVYHRVNSAELPLSARRTLLEEAVARGDAPPARAHLSRDWLAGLAPAVPATGNFGPRLLDRPGRELKNSWLLFWLAMIAAALSSIVLPGRCPRPRLSLKTGWLSAMAMAGVCVLVCLVLGVAVGGVSALPVALLGVNIVLLLVLGFLVAEMLKDRLAAAERCRGALAWFGGMALAWLAAALMIFTALGSA